MGCAQSLAALAPAHQPVPLGTAQVAPRGKDASAADFDDGGSIALWRAESLAEQTVLGTATSRSVVPPLRSGVPAAKATLKSGPVSDTSSVATRSTRASSADTTDLGQSSTLEASSDCSSSISQAPTSCTAASSASGRRLEIESLPEKMTSLSLAVTNFRAGDFTFEMSEDGTHVTGWSLEVEALGFAARQLLTPQLPQSEKQAIRGSVSECHHITLTEEELAELDIASEARFVVFSYPIVTEKEWKMSSKDAEVVDVAFLTFGGYMYFDSEMALLDIRAVVPTSDGGLRFGPPRPWQQEWTLAGSLDRWRPVALPSLRAAGARHFTWLQPGEKLEGTELCRNGGFAFLFHDPMEVGVLQARLDVYFALEDEAIDHGKGCPACSRLLEWSDCCEGPYAGGWTCEYYHSCSVEHTEEAPARWCCRHCQLDMCDSCYGCLKTDGQARRKLHATSGDVGGAACRR